MVNLKKKSRKEVSKKLQKHQGKTKKQLSSVKSCSLSSKAAQRQNEQLLKKGEAVRGALASVFSASGDENNATTAAVDLDEYGKGSPTDRLQFGYAPANVAEAVAFHSLISGAEWVAERRRQAFITIVKKQKLPRFNCEPMESILKLKEHWRNTAQFLAEVRADNTAQTTADDLLEMFASQQRTA